jgi:hypothetical protein
MINEHRVRKGATKGIENISNKIVVPNVPNLDKEMINKVQELLKTPNRQDKERISSCHIVLKTLGIQNEEGILKVARHKCQDTYKCKIVRITAYFSTQILKARRAWVVVF